MFNVEIFDTRFNIVSHTTIDSASYEYDYLVLTNNNIKLAGAVKAFKGNYVYIRESSKKYIGIICDITNTTTHTSIEIKPLLGLLDVNVYYDRSVLNEISLENYLKNLIESKYVHNEDTLQNIEGFKCEVKTHTYDAKLNLVDNIHNIYMLVQKAFKQYNVVIDFDVDIQNKLITAIIQSKETKIKIIEADLKNIISKNIILGKSGEELNKLTMFNKANENNTLTYYKHTTGTISQIDENRILPVVDNVIYLECEEEEFENKAYEKAHEKLNYNFDNLIEITVKHLDNLVKPEERYIGEVTEIISNQNIYTSVLTGYVYKEGTVKLIYGAIRTELTKKLKKEKRNNEY